MSWQKKFRVSETPVNTDTMTMDWGRQDALIKGNRNDDHRDP
jgi:hypothetical protein